MTRPVTDELTVVCYDIASDRRRRRVVGVLEGYGMRVQESVFECWLSPARFHQLQARLRQAIKDDEDRLAFYRLTREALHSVRLLGQQSTVSGNPSCYVV